MSQLIAPELGASDLFHAFSHPLLVQHKWRYFFHLIVEMAEAAGLGSSLAAAGALLVVGQRLFGAGPAEDVLLIAHSRRLHYQRQADAACVFLCPSLQYCLEHISRCLPEIWLRSVHSSYLSPRTALFNL